MDFASGVDISYRFGIESWVMSDVGNLIGVSPPAEAGMIGGHEQLVGPDESVPKAVVMSLGIANSVPNPRGPGLGNILITNRLDQSGMTLLEGKDFDRIYDHFGPHAILVN